MQSRRLVSRYVVSIVLKRVFMFKCNLSMLRLVPLLGLLALPPALARIFAFHARERPPSLLAPRADAVILAGFPIAWFFGFLYYTEVPGLLAVAATVAAAAQGRHWIAGLVRRLCGEPRHTR
jgi:alpha-1,2-glucosyltransferase